MLEYALLLRMPKATMSNSSESLLLLAGQTPDGGVDPWLTELAKALCSSRPPPDKALFQARLLLSAWYVRAKSKAVAQWADNPGNAEGFRQSVLDGLSEGDSENELLSWLETMIREARVEAGQPQ